MKADKVIGQGSGGARTKLSEALPLDTPFGIYIFPVYHCNFKCNYCLYSLEKEKHGLNFKDTHMKLSLFKKCVDDISHFNNKLKMFRFAGLGEPLLHKDIAEMVQYAVEKKISNTVEIITNGSLLTRELSDKLIQAGLSKLFISIQGLTADRYKEVSNVELNIDKFIENIRYFYEHKKDTKIYIKILDYSLKSKEEEEQFYHMFGSVCDTIAIEKVAPIMSQVDYTDIVKEEQKNTIRGNEFEDINICPFPFYLMQINPDGSVFPCCAAEKMPSIGNCNTMSVTEVWNNMKFNNLRRIMLSGAHNLGEGFPCKECKAYQYSTFPEDRISATDADRLKKMYES